MRRYITVSLILVLLIPTIFLTGCGGNQNKAAEFATPMPTPQPIVDVPKWFLNPPKDPNYLHATATGTSTDLGYALINAESEGRKDISGQIATKVSGMLKRFREEIGAGEDAALLASTTAISQEVVSEVINGCRAVKKDVKQEDSMTYRGYVLMEMPIGLANTTLVKKIKSDKKMYTRFRASQAFSELEAELEKYEGQQK